MYVRILILFVAFSFCFAGPARGERAYVTDSFRITFRTGPSLENKILAMLVSGQAVEVLESQGEWSRVRLLDKDGEEEGWVLTRYLTYRVPWEVRARKLEKENMQLKEKLEELNLDLQRTMQRERESSGQLASTVKALTRLKKDYVTLKEGSAGYLKLKASYDQIQSRLEKIQRDFDLLNKEYDRLKDSQRTRWFIAGASVLLCGLIVGLILGKKQKKRRSSYY
ncbi:MAG: TIGR04211 family SH3 domain-containing protein [Deltaproteobacteria bacterium]|nr:TIGR04211 family SH3 domain-containing protein [Deltaproteobacteria bacterium]